ncbi:hypothetical protein BAUCODRAFT_35874 [Baudoinia panamericana UAMH 10762]|uniref:Uncharacterized protein n=1 Tax=Baudoinia panamericana (strain UAMH 10762) TaxID=717646 RepID=M2N773_BAUPA|nr:uncharacterized protein BAUCODRAFT_35874 [Baudoinia panamericana UAMH 10762]EMC94640.1 hypothetical protein BAUCODRAFT_35874 [Baudoinia panamericana UAMH 10762]
MSKEIGFTSRDFELFAGALMCAKVPVEIDYKAFAEKFGFKNANSGKASWHTLKKKLDKLAASTGGSSLTSPAYH